MTNESKQGKVSTKSSTSPYYKNKKKHTVKTKSGTRRGMGIVTRAKAGLCSTRTRRERKPSRLLLDSLESEEYALPPRNAQNRRTNHVAGSASALASSSSASAAVSPKPSPSGSTNKKTKTKRTYKQPLADLSDIDLDMIQCCLCHGSIDYSDKEIFKPAAAATTAATDTHKEKDPSMMIPPQLYDAQNGILICDYPGCHRAYHQRCHFVPVLSIPKGHWYCLICKFQLEYRDKHQKEDGYEMKENKDKPSSFIQNSTTQLEALMVPLTALDFQRLYPSKMVPTIQDHGDYSHDYLLLCSRFEFQSASLKRQLLHHELSSRFKSTIQTQLSHIRRAKDTIRTYTTVQSVLKSLMEDYLKYGTLPQEFIQGVLLMARSKMKIRDLFYSLEKLVQNWDEITILESHTSSNLEMNNDGSIIQETCNKYGKNHYSNKRIEPRFDIKDYDADEDDDSNEDDDDSTDPTEKIKCCVCFSGHVVEGDENDVLMCDGQSCMKAFHMKCITPRVTQKILDDDVNGTWFCPLCTAFANCIHDCRIEYLGDESKDSLKHKYTAMDDDSRDDISEDTWDKACDVFPEAPNEMNAAETWMSKSRTDESDKYLSSLLGIDIPEPSLYTENSNGTKSLRSATATSNKEKNRISIINDSCHESDDFNHEDTILETINVSNIIKGKRTRGNVDYKRYVAPCIL